MNLHEYVWIGLLLPRVWLTRCLVRLLLWASVKAPPKDTHKKTRNQRHLSSLHSVFVLTTDQALHKRFFFLLFLSHRTLLSIEKYQHQKQGAGLQEELVGGCCGAVLEVSWQREGGKGERCDGSVVGSMSEMLGGAGCAMGATVWRGSGLVCWVAAAGQ